MDSASSKIYLLECPKDNWRLWQTFISQVWKQDIRNATWWQNYRQYFVKNSSSRHCHDFNIQLCLLYVLLCLWGRDVSKECSAFCMVIQRPSFLECLTMKTEAHDSSKRRGLLTLRHSITSQKNGIISKTYLLTYSTVQSPSSAANWFAASQEIPRISRNPKVHYRTHKRTPPVSILDKKNLSPVDDFHFLSRRKNHNPPALTVPPLSHLTPCTPTTSNLYLPNSLSAALKDPAL